MAEDLVVVEMMNMGFSKAACVFALRARQGHRDRAIDWLLQDGRSIPSDGPNPESIAMLESLGFTPSQARAGLRFSSNVEHAANWIMENPLAGTEEVGEQAPVDAVNGDYSAVQDKGHQFQTEAFMCPICCMTGPDELTGFSYCAACKLCIACCAAGLADRCPALANGGNWHQHSLSYRKGEELNCSIRGLHCQRNRGDCWSCDRCDFHVCPTCLARAPPAGFQRQGRHGDGVGRGGGEGKGSGKGWQLPSFDPAAAERHAAGDWEEGLGFQRQPSKDSSIVGAGFIGDEGDDRRADRLLRDDAPAVGTVAFATKDGAGGPKLERMLSEPSKIALKTFASGTGLPRHTGTWQSAGSCARQADGGPCLHVGDMIPGCHWSCCGSLDLRATGCADGEQSAQRSIADVTTAEQLLAQAASAGFDRLKHDDFRAAVAAGELGIAAQLLMGTALNKNTDGKASADSSAQLCPVCAEEVGPSSGPGGAIACFNGHALHAACAADLALGGSVCPTCRGPLFYAQVERAEAIAATTLDGALGEQQTIVEEPEAPGPTSKHIFRPGDVVLIADDAEKCQRLQSLPGCGGFTEGMERACGSEGHIVEVNDEEGDVEVRPTWVEVCSHNSGDTWRWHPDLLTFLRVALDEEDTGAAVEDSNAAAKTAVEQLARLRAELAAVKRARETIQGEIAKVIGIEIPSPSDANAGASTDITKPPKLERVLTRGSAQAVVRLGKTVAPVDMQRARHLLALARQWGDEVEACEARAALHAAVCAGDLDSVARVVRRRNAITCMSRLAWVDASRATSAYRVVPGVRAELLTRPKRGASRTGFVLSPLVEFTSTREVVDPEGNLWLRVGSAAAAVEASGCLAEAVPESSSAPDKSKIAKGERVSYYHFPRAEGMRVTRGPDWNMDEVDGGPGNEGVILQRTARYSSVSVRWQVTNEVHEHRAGTEDAYDLIYAEDPPLDVPPPQGWLRMRPTGPGTQCVAAITRGAMRCFDCGGDLVPPTLRVPAAGNSSAAFAPVSAVDVKIGDKVLVASTLEAVTIVRKVTKIGDDPAARKIRALLLCRFDDDNDGSDEDEDSLVAFRTEDLVWPGPVPKNSTRPMLVGGEELCPYQGALRSRRELVLMLKSEDAARAVWAEHMVSDRNSTGEEHLAMTFASCVRGHLLHARCFQGRLVAGRCCPACPEPLYVPRVQRNRTDDDDCCHAVQDAAAEALRVVGATEEELQQSAARATEREESRILEVVLKMCPICCSGPLYNENCSDLKAHHGQCPRCEDFPYTPAQIAEMMVKQCASSVGVAIPRCRNCEVAVYFNGCQSCGYLFADIDWEALPTWDEKAKGRLEAKHKERQAARLLAAQVRQEAALLAHERAALAEAAGDEEMPSLCADAMPPPAPAKVPPRPQLCGPSCYISHRGRLCQVCWQVWEDHDDHYCANGSRGQWILNDDELLMPDRRDYDEEEEE